MGALAAALEARGYGHQDAINAENGPRAAELTREYLGGGSSSIGTSSFQPLTAPDYQKLEEQAFNMVRPYYIQLAKESQGDFNRAKLALEEDYKRNTKLARQEYAIKKDAEEKALQGSLAQLGVKFGAENENLVDDLNKRGAAVYQMGPDNQFNVAGTQAPLANLGRGGFEVNRLKQDQSLRQEAVQRATDKNLAELGFNLGKITSGTPEGQLPNANADRTNMGSEELGYLRGTERETRQAQLTGQQLAEARRQNIGEIAGKFANTQTKEIPTALQNQYLRNMQTDFTQYGA